MPFVSELHLAKFSIFPWLQNLLHEGITQSLEMLGGRRKRECLSPYSVEIHVSGASQGAAKKKTGKRTRGKYETQNVEDCELIGVTLTPKRSVVLICKVIFKLTM